MTYVGAALSTTMSAREIEMTPNHILWALSLQAARLAEYSAEHTHGTFKLILLLGCINALACTPLEPMLLLWERCCQRQF